ncbi:SGNH/GDSL hydrolase family protein [Chitinophaga sp. CF418]|uniref:SGNH/GDSL hydrolase family protein n=1 Tax=Chitinophaga sp. CF418 TaxID=1855287 RepID=UPI0009168A4E|nr:SGNH/GDSL hydrolase family protein [Chitinophaga sp. CF418]SHN45960.1 hypothetical protein SAMN05216311_12250 [Chitinophaga sp. CF418]
MKLRLLILSLFVALSSTAQINDTAVLRNYINANVIENGTRSVTATQLYYSLTGLLNVSNRYKIDSINLKSDSLIYYTAGKRRALKFNQPGVDSVRLSSDSLYFRRIQGGEIPIRLDYYTRSQSDNRYVLSPSGKLTANWLTAWDYAISSEAPNLTNLEDRYLVVNGTAGDTAFTVSGGTGMADFVPNYVAAAYAKADDKYFSFFVVRQSGGTYHTDRPLKYSLVNDTVKFIWSSYQGQHLSDYGYRGYADMIYDYHKSLAQKDYKLYSFFPEDGGTIPFVAINGATQGGFIPSTSIPQLYSQTTATINYSQIAVNHFVIQQGGVADRGGEWSVNLGKKRGYCETWVGINRNLPGYAKINFYLDGVLKETKFVRGGVQKLTFNYANASSGKLQIVTADAQNTAIRVGKTIWYQTDLDTIPKAYQGGKIMFVGDSWTQHRYTGGNYLKSSPERFRARWQGDGGDPADIINVGRGGMTSAWGKYWFKYWLNLYHPKYVYIEFYINDSNSSGFVGDGSTTTWNFDSTDPYGAGLDVDGKVTQQNWLDNIKWMKDTALAYGATPIILMPTPTASATQTQAISAWNSALRPATQYYDIETFFSSGVYGDNSANAPLISAATGNIDTVATKEIKGGTASISGSMLIELQATNSSTTKGGITYPKVNYTGSSGHIWDWQNLPTLGSGVVGYIANNGLWYGAGGFTTPGAYTIPPFQISYASGIARASATNSTTVQDWYLGDSLTGVLRFRIPAVLANYTTSTLPASGIRRVKGALVYDTDVEKPAVTDGFSWSYLAKESLVLARFDSITAKDRFIQNISIAGTAQSASFNITGQGMIAGTNSYKLFLSRPDMTSSAVLAFKTGTDTSGYVGLPSLLNRDVSLVGLKGSAAIRTSDTARIIFGSHSPEYSYVVGKKGKWLFGDSVQRTPTIPLEVESAQDTSILTAHKIIGNGIISNSTITVSSAPAYASGGITTVGRNNTTGRLETFTPNLSPVGVVYGDGTLTTFPTNVDYLILQPTGNNTIELSSTATYTGSAGRVAVILNTTNFTYTIAGTTVSSKYVYVAWYANNTPSFINL